MNAKYEGQGSVPKVAEERDCDSLPTHDFYLVGIGASDGDATALETLFQRMPTHTRMAFVVLLLSPSDQASPLSQRIAQQTQMPVKVARHGVRIEPDHIYISPHEQAVTISGQLLLLASRRGRGSPSLLDDFFCSLAQSARQRAIGVLLAGVGEEQVEGAETLRAVGGFVIAQGDDPTANNAKLSRRGLRHADLVLSPAEIPDALLQHAGVKPQRDGPLAVDSHETSHPRASANPQATIEGLRAANAELQRANEALRAEHEMLHRNEVRMRNIVESAMDAVIGMDEQGLVTRWNSKAETMFRFSADEAIGQPLADLIIPPDFADAHWNGLRRFLATGQASILNKRLELTAIRRGGQRFPVELTVAAYRIAGQYEFSAFVRDITQRRHAERRLATEHAVSQVLINAQDLASAAPQILAAFCRTLEVDLCELWLPDPEGNGLVCAHYYSNLADESFAAIREATLRMRMAPGEGLVGQVYQRREPLWSTDLAGERIFPRFQAAVEAGLTSVYAFPLMLHREALGVFCFGSREELPPNVALLDTMLAIGHDLGQFVRRARFEHELNDARRAAEAANEAKSAFLANMSHEIRTPMTSVVGLTELLLASETDPSRIEMLQMVQRSSHHLVELINDILDLSKIESGKLAVDRVDCSPVELVQDLASVMSVRAREKGLSFEVRFEGRIPSTILTDPMRLRQILINLVGNAIKFTNQGGIRIVTRYLPEADPPRIEFEVSDTGIGMSPAEVARLFEPFSQVDHSVTRRFGGTGLGLCISQRLANALQGEIFAESEPKVGSTFRLQIATSLQAPSDLVDPAQHEPAAVQQPQRSEVSLDCHALVAEDTRGIQYLIKRFLEGAGAHVTLAGNGQDALDRLHDAQQSGRPVDVVIMDMHMPVLSGYDTVARLRAEGSPVPIIALTARAMQGDREKCLSIGCDAYLPKPVDRRQLLDAVARLLSSSGSESVKS